MEDVDFLREDESRGVRLQLEYQKAEALLRRHGVRHTVLVMGARGHPGAARTTRWRGSSGAWSGARAGRRS